MTSFSYPRVFVDDRGTGFAYVLDKEFSAVRGPDGLWDSPAPYISDQVLLANYRLLDDEQARALTSLARQAILKMIGPFRLPAKSITADFNHVPAVLTPFACWVKVEDRWIMNERAWGESKRLPRDLWLIRFNPLPPLPAAAFHQRQSAPFELPAGARPFLWRGYPCVLVCGICLVFNGEMWTIDASGFSEWSELERVIWRNRFQNIPQLPKIPMMDIGREPFRLPEGASPFVDGSGLQLVLPDQSCHNLKKGAWVKIEPTQARPAFNINSWCDHYETLPPFPRQYRARKTVTSRQVVLPVAPKKPDTGPPVAVNEVCKTPYNEERLKMLVTCAVVIISWLIYIS